VREKVLRYIRERKLMRAGDRVCVAVSGGADSVALLRVLLELRAQLGIVLSVAHFNHGLRGEASETDKAFVTELARQHELEFFSSRGDVRDHALTGTLSLEAAARELRYAWLALLAESHKLNDVATAHTIDDQAETVLLKFLRGAGTRGLAGIYPEIAIAPKVLDPIQSAERGEKAVPLYQDNAPWLPGPRIIRPLLGATREEVERYLTALGQAWREDESNFDSRFARNRVRHALLPLLEREYNPNIRHVLSDAAELSRAEEEYWQALVEQELQGRRPAERSGKADLRVRAQAPYSCYPEPPSVGEGSAFPDPAASRLSLDNFAKLPLALQRRLLKRLLESEAIPADFEHIEKLLHCALGELPNAELPGGWMGARRGKCLELRAPQAQHRSPGYQYRLPIPGEVQVAEIALTVRSVPVPQAFAREAGPPENLLSADLLGLELTVRNWRPGDRFHPGHSGSEEKLKRLFSERHIAVEQRQSWPVVLAGEQIVWVHGFPVARAFAWNGRGDAVKIELF
jgi:tRNA(Ile)-lysidine synthase